MKRNSFKLLFIALSFCVTNSHAMEPAKQLGELHMALSPKNSQTANFFYNGLLLLHSFQYEEARESFISAQKLDRRFAMAYWGEAMTYNHPVWNEQDYAAANAALAKLAPTADERIAKSATALEKGFMRAVNQLYGQGSKLDRDNYYEMAMQDLYKKFPEESEVSAFYALALLGRTQGHRDTVNYMRSAGILEHIYEKNRNHPGVLHYLIHTYDDPVHSPLGLRFADRYALVSPAAAHALHMPSHIYFSLGMWDKAITSNRAAWCAGLEENKRSGDYDIHALHALQWLSYANLQLKYYDESYRQVKVMEEIVAADPANAMKQWYYSLMRSAYMSDTENWHSELREPLTNGLEISAVANDLYVRGMQSIADKKSNQDIEAVIEQLRKLSSLSASETSVGDHHRHGLSYFDTVNDTGITTAKIVYLSLEAQRRRSQKDLASAIQFAQQASHIENDLSFGYGPPSPVKPTDELLAELYAENHQYNVAIEHYLKALKRNPNRTRSVAGLEKARKQLAT